MTLEEQEKWYKAHKRKIINLRKKDAIELYREMEQISRKFRGENYDVVERIKEKADYNKNDYWEKKYGRPYEIEEDRLYKSLIDAEKFNPKSDIHEMSNCKEMVGKIDLKPWLKKIRNNDYETMIVLFIKQNKVVDSLFIKGSSMHVGSFAGEKMKQVLHKAKELNAGIYLVHNHPYIVAAWPSVVASKSNKIIAGDIGARKKTGQYLKKIGINFLDFAVVTPFDYYSSLQKEGKDFYKNTKPWIDDFNAKRKLREQKEMEN